MVESDRDLIEIQSQYFHGVAEENHDRPQE
jgi:hypothetical protein